jgi:general secretion pathway protein C
MTQRAPLIASFLLFLLLCASAAYWLLQWLAPEPRPVAAPPQAERSLPPVAAASTLFGGRAQGRGMGAVQLRGIIRSGRPGASIAILTAEGQPTRALPVDAEVAPGLMIKEIRARTVVLSEHGAERELSLPEFVAQEGGTLSLQPGMAGPQPVSPQFQPQAQQQAQQQPAPLSMQPQPAAAGASGGGSTSGAPGSPGSAPPGSPSMQAPAPALTPTPMPTPTPTPTR